MKRTYKITSRKKTLLILLALLTIQSLRAQSLISKFDFNSEPMTNATAGPNATSINAGAQTNGTGVFFTSGGATTGVDLVIPGATFDVANIDIKFEFAKNENTADFFQRGGMRIYVTGGNLYFNYRTYTASGHSYNDRVLGPYSMGANGISGSFDFYEFGYKASTGEASVYKNGTLVLYDDGPNNRDLYWIGAGDATVGGIMDGSSTGFVFLGSISIYDGVVALPVELTSFTARTVANKIQLQWTTATEKNNYGFEIHRSNNSVDWATIGFVEGNGSKNTPTSYVFEDVSPIVGVTKNMYYQLKQIDRDGTYAYSPIVSVSVAGGEKSKLFSATPNPFNPTTKISFYLHAPQQVSMHLYNTLGQVVREIYSKENFDQGFHSVTIFGEGLASGMYYLSLKTLQETFVTQLILCK